MQLSVEQMDMVAVAWLCNRCSTLCEGGIFASPRRQRPRQLPDVRSSGVQQVVFILCICLSFLYCLQYSEPTDHQDITRLCTPSNSRATPGKSFCKSYSFYAYV
jgi:hypothetical protein